jgi:hypothetical protein
MATVPLLYTQDTVNGSARVRENDWLRLTDAERAAEVIPANFSYPPGDIRRYGAKIDGSTDDTNAIRDAISAAVATGGIGYIFHPGGVCCHLSQISVPNNLTVLGRARHLAEFQFIGTPSGSPACTRSAWRYFNGPNSSGYAHVSFKHCKFSVLNTVDFGAVIELNAGGWSYFEIDDCWIAGNSSYGIILDAVEICSVHNCLIENINSTSNYNIWIVNGGNRTFGALTFTGSLSAGATSATLTPAWAGTNGDWVITFSNGDQRKATLTNGSTAASWLNGLTTTATTSATAGQGQGFTNRITIRENQISGVFDTDTGYGILDDGGNSHWITSNNCNQNQIAAYFAGCQNLTVEENSFETLVTSPATPTGSANCYFNDVSGDDGTPVGPCRAFQYKNGHYGDVVSTSPLLVFNCGLHSISAITKANPCVLTFSTGGTKHPFVIGEQVYLSGVSGMTQINGQNLWITALGGSSGAWKVTVVLDSSAYGTYTSGGQGSMYHRSGVIWGGSFANRIGRSAAIDVKFLAHSIVGPNLDESVSSSFTHYANVHNDAMGNILLPPQNGFIGTPGISGVTFGDTRYPMQFEQGVTSFGQYGANGATPPTQITGFGSPSGSSVVSNFPGASATLLQTSQTVAEILTILKNAGVIGS